MDLRRLLEILEERQEAYRKTWRRLKRSDKVIIIGLIALGLLNVLIGSAMVCSGG